MTLDPIEIEQKCKSEWDTDPQIRAEFSCLENYVACVKAEQAGTVKVIGGEESGGV